MKGLFGKAILATTLLVGLATGSAFAAKGDIVGGQGGATYGGTVTTLGTITTTASVNVNGTMTGIKNVNGQLTHTAYKDNTNSCASCHMTHTASSKNLLFGTGVEDTCTSCHDGTLGFYDVVAGKAFPTGSVAVNYTQGYVTLGDTVGSNAGRFAFASGATGSTPDISARAAKNPSMHNTGSSNLKLSAAPGGNRTGAGGETKWSSTTFTCASCHAPHGSYSDRLLHYNPNGFATVDVKKGGYGLTTRDYLTVAEATARVATVVDDFIIVYGSAQEHADWSTTSDTVDLAYFGNLAVDPTHYQAYDSNKVVMVYKKSGTSWAIDTTPWIDSTNVGNPSDQSRIPAIAQIEATWRGTGTKPAVYTAAKAFVSDENIAAPNGTLKAGVARPAIVSLDLVKVAETNTAGVTIPLYVSNNSALVGGQVDPNGNIVGKLGITTSLSYGDVIVNGGGKQMSTFCAACHTDYLAKSGSASGVYDTTKFRHTTNNDSYSCVKCHYAHGTDQDLQRDALGNMTVTPDVNPSSALKRYVNMSVCWGCHTSSKQSSLVNNKDYNFGAYPVPQGLHDDISWSNGNKWGVQN